MLSESNFENVLFLGLAPKADGIEANAPQKIDKEGLPVWTLSALVKAPEGLYEGLTFNLSAPKKMAEEIMTIKDLTPIKLFGLKGGKWSKYDSSETKWSFSITGGTASSGNQALDSLNRQFGAKP